MMLQDNNKFSTFAKKCVCWGQVPQASTNITRRWMRVPDGDYPTDLLNANH